MLFTLKEPGIGQDFIYQYFRHDNPVSPPARKEFVRNFPAVFRIPTTTDSASSDVTSILASKDMDPYATNSSPIETSFSFTKTFAKLLGPDHREIRRIKTWKMHFNSILLKKHRNFQEEMILRIAIFLYFVVLIVISMPPALLAKGVRVANIVRYESMNSFKEALKRTVSRSQSLTALAKYTRQTSTEFKVLIKGYE
jgi:hypothetical protein